MTKDKIFFNCVDFFNKLNTTNKSEVWETYCDIKHGKYDRLCYDIVTYCNIDIGSYCIADFEKDCNNFNIVLKTAFVIAVQSETIKL